MIATRITHDHRKRAFFVVAQKQNRREKNATTRGILATKNATQKRTRPAWNRRTMTRGSAARKHRIVNKAEISLRNILGRTTNSRLINQLKTKSMQKNCCIRCSSLRCRCCHCVCSHSGMASDGAAHTTASSEVHDPESVWVNRYCSGHGGQVSLVAVPGILAPFAATICKAPGVQRSVV